MENLKAKIGRLLSPLVANLGAEAAASKVLTFHRPPPEWSDHAHRAGIYRGLPGWFRIRGGRTFWDGQNDRVGYSGAELRRLRAERGVGSVRRVDPAVRQHW